MLIDTQYLPGALADQKYTEAGRSKKYAWMLRTAEISGAEISSSSSTPAIVAGLVSRWWSALRQWADRWFPSRPALAVSHEARSR